MKLNHYGAIFGFLTAALLLAGVIISGNSPMSDAPEAEWVSYVEDDGALHVVRAYLFIGAGLCMVAFYACGIRPRFTETTVADQAIVGIGASAALAAAGALAVGGLVGATAGAANFFSDIPIDGALARQLNDLYLGFLVVGSAVPFAVVMAVVAIQAQRQGAFGRAITVFSVLGILGMAAALLFLPMALLLVWLIATSVAVLRMGTEPRSRGQALAATTR